MEFLEVAFDEVAEFLRYFVRIVGHLAQGIVCGGRVQFFFTDIVEEID